MPNGATHHEVQALKALEASALAASVRGLSSQGICVGVLGAFGVFFGILGAFGLGTYPRDVETESAADRSSLVVYSIPNVEAGLGNRRANLHEIDIRWDHRDEPGLVRRQAKRGGLAPDKDIGVGLKPSNRLRDLPPVSDLFQHRVADLDP
jgi:hypothetical protein